MRAPFYCPKKISKQNISNVLVSQSQVTELKKSNLTDIVGVTKACRFPYDRWRSFTIAGIATKLFSDRSDHIETKFSFCPRSPTIPEIAKT